MTDAEVIAAGGTVENGVQMFPKKKVETPTPEIMPAKAEGTVIESKTKEEWRQIHKEEKLAQKEKDLNNAPQSLKDKMLASRIETYKQAKELFDVKGTNNARNQMNSALRDVKELDPNFKLESPTPKIEKKKSKK